MSQPGTSTTAAPATRPPTERRGRVEAMWIKRAVRGPMDGAETVTLVAGRGIEGNANQGGQRQVTVIEQEVFTGLRHSLSPDVEPVMRRANLMVSGVRLEGSRHRILCIGTGRIEIRGETRPCEQMDEALPGLRRALEAHEGGGAFGRVIQGGTVAVGDEAWLEDGGGDADESP